MDLLPKEVLPKGVCVKVGSLRPAYDNLEEWLSNPKHVLVCRPGRVFIGKKDYKRIFHYKGSQFANPYTIKEYSLEKSLELYEQHLDKLLTDDDIKTIFLELANVEEIGCFCNPGSKCHRDVILRKLSHLVEK